MIQSIRSLENEKMEKPVKNKTEAKLAISVISNVILLIFCLVAAAGLCFLTISATGCDDPCVNVQINNVFWTWLIEEELDYQQPLARIDEVGIPAFEEVKVWSLSESGTPVMEIVQEEGNSALLIGSQDGRLFRVDILSEEMSVVQTFDGEILDFSFSASGEMLLVRWLNDEGVVSAYAIQDLSEEIVLHQEENDRNAYQHVIIDPSGTYMIKHDTQSWLINIYFIDGFHRISDNLHLTDEEEVYVPLPNISAVAGEYFGDYAAVAFETGRINIGPLNTGDFFSGMEIVDMETEDQEIVTRDFRFSLNNEYLIWLTDNELIVWRMGGIRQGTRNDLFLRGPLAEGNVAAVDRAGKWLVVGGETGLKIFNVKSAYAQYEVDERILPVAPIKEFETDSAVTSLYFSRDNRLLIWGDAEGNVHLWGVPLD
jgi:hypothetical protein